MTATRRAARGARAVRAVLAGFAVLASGVIVAVPASLPTSPPASATAAPVADTSVRVRIDDVSPSVVPRSTTRQPLSIRVTLTNSTDTAISGLRLEGYRGDPIGNQGALDTSLDDTSPASGGIRIPATTAVRLDLPANQSVSTTFSTTISVLDDGRGLCQCSNAIYPIIMRARIVDSNDEAVTLGSATTYIPSIVENADKVGVSWLWPLIDRPHRVASDTVFVDDDLSTSVNGGRLDRALRVVEGLDAGVPLTLIVDPELLDELVVMADGQYTVATPGSTAQPVAGTGASAAQAWLTRFTAMLVSHPRVGLSLTPYADPDIQALARDRLTWSTVLPTEMAQRVASVLGGRSPSTDVAWASGGAVGRRALNAMAASGVRTLVVNGSSLSPSESGGVPVALARLSTSGSPVAALATSPAMQRQASAAVAASSSASGDGSANAALPELIAEIAVRAVQNDDAGYAVITPPRYFDPDPQRAIRTIEDTSSNAYAVPVAARGLRAQVPSQSSSTRESAADTAADALPQQNVDAARKTAASQPAVSSLLDKDTDAQPLVSGLAHAPQRLSSSAWAASDTESPFNTALGPQFARAVTDRVDGVLDGVRIVTPPSSSYTLGSNDSSLPITIENTLPYNVDVQLELTPQSGLPGYMMGALKPPQIASNSKQTVQVPSHLEGAGRIRVNATISAPNGRPLGEPVLLYVRSTDFGAIGIVITAVAGGVLALALLVRFVRRLQRLRRKAREAESPRRRTHAAKAGVTAGTESR